MTVMTNLNIDNTIREHQSLQNHIGNLFYGLGARDKRDEPLLNAPRAVLARQGLIIAQKLDIPLTEPDRIVDVLRQIWKAVGNVPGRDAAVDAIIDRLEEVKP
jgi:hypothetical protein